MKKEEYKKINEVAEKLNWQVDGRHNNFEFSATSPAGQDFNVHIFAENISVLFKELSEQYDDFDCSEETYAWLDSSGHGTNGAPYDMKDLYEDMEACREMIRELAVAIEKVS